MSYMKALLEESRIHIEAKSSNGKKKYSTDIKASSPKEAEINFFGLMRKVKHLEPGDDYKINVLKLRSELA